MASEIDDLKFEIAQLRLALRHARQVARQLHGTTTREFAALIGVSAHQLSQWTCDKLDADPDFIRNGYAKGTET